MAERQIAMNFWAGLRNRPDRTDPAPESWLRARAVRRAEPGAAPGLARSLAAFGLADGELLIEADIEPPDAPGDPHAFDHAARLRWRIEIEDGAGERATATAHRTDPVALPWPSTPGSNLFRTNGFRYAVRPELRPLPGVYRNEYPASTADAPSGFEREIALLPVGGVRREHLVVSSRDPLEGTGDDLRLIVRDEHGFTRRSFGERNVRRTLARLAHQQHPALRLAANGRTEQALQRLWLRHTNEPRPGAGRWLDSDDLDLLVRTLRDRTAYDPHESIHSLTQQEIRFPIQAMRDAIGDGPGGALRALTTDLLGLEVASETHAPIVRVAPRAQLGAAPEPLAALAERIAQWLEQPEQTAVVQDRIADWRARARVVALRPDGPVADPALGLYNRLSHTEVAHAVLLSSRRLTRDPESLKANEEVALPPVAFPFLSPTGVAHASNVGGACRLALGACAVPVNLGSRMAWVPAMRATDRATGESVDLPIERLVETPMEVGTGARASVLLAGEPAPRDAPEPRYHLDELSIASAAHAASPWSRYLDGTREALSENYAVQAVNVVRQNLFSWFDPDTGEPIPRSQIPPTRNWTVAILTGGHRTFEDTIVVNEKTARDTDLALVSTHGIDRRTEENPAIEYLGPPGGKLDSIAAQTGIAPEAFRHLGPQGLVRIGTVLEEGDVIQLARVRRAAGPGGALVEEWIADRAGKQWCGQVTGLASSAAPPEEADDDDADLAPGERPQWFESDEHDTHHHIGERIEIELTRVVPVADSFKVFTLGGVKGMITLCAPEEMPCDAAGRPADMVISDLSIVARMAFGDLLQIRYGAKRDAAIEALASDLGTLDETFTGVDPGTLRAGLEPETRTLAALLQERIERRASVLRHHPFQSDAPVRLLDALGLAEAPWSAGAIAAAVRAFPDIALDTTLALAVSPTRAELAAIDRALDVEADGRNAVHANRAAFEAGRTLERPGLMGPMPIGILPHLGIRHESIYPLTSARANTMTGQVESTATANASRAGVMEMDIWFGAGVQRVVGEFLTLSDAGALAHYRRAVAEGRDPGDPIARHTEANAHIARLFQGAAIAWDEHRPVTRPRSAQEIRAASHGAISEVTEPGYDEHGLRLTGSLHDPQIFGSGLANGCSCGRRYPARGAGVCGCERHEPVFDARRAREVFAHIELPVPVLHPWAVAERAFVAALLNLDPGTLRHTAHTHEYTYRSKPVQNPVASGTSENRAHPDRNGPRRLQDDLRALTVRARTEPETLIAEARASEAAAERARDTGRLLRARDHRAAIERLAANPQFAPEHFVLDAIPVLPAHMRAGYTPLGSAGTGIDDFDRAYRAIVVTAGEIRAGTLAPRDATRVMSRAVERLMNGHQPRFARDRQAGFADALGAKHGALARLQQGFRSAASARMSILPADLRTVPSTHVSIPAKTATRLFRHLAEPALERIYGLTAQEAKAEIDRNTARARDVTRRAAAATTTIANRAPTIHQHSMIAFEAHIPFEESASDIALKIPPTACLGFNADFDGDAMALFVPVSAAAVREARYSMGLAEHRMKAGDGSAMTAVRHAALVGLVHHLAAAPHAPQHPRTPRAALLALIDPDAAAHARAALDEHPEHADAWAGANGAHPKAAELSAFFERFARASRRTHRDNAALLRSDDNLWIQGFETAERIGAAITPDQLEHLAEAFSQHIAHDAPAPQRPRVATRAERVAFMHDAAERFDGNVERLRTFMRESAPADPKIAAVYELMETGGRISWDQLMRLAGEAGATKGLNGDPSQHYITRSLVEGIDIADRHTLDLGTWSGIVASKNNIGEMGHLGGLLTQAMRELQVTEEDCRVTEPTEITLSTFRDEAVRDAWTGATFESREPLTIARHRPVPEEPQADRLSVGDTLDERLAEALHTFAHRDPGTAAALRLTLRKPALTLPVDRHLEGLALARPSAFGGETYEAGTILFGAVLDEALKTAERTPGMRLPVRSIAQCQAPSGKCAACVGAERFTGGARPSLGEHVGTRAGTSLNELGVQPALKTFHTGGVINRKSGMPLDDGIRTNMHRILQRATARLAPDAAPEPENRAEPRRGEFTRVWRDAAPVERHAALAASFHAILEANGIADPEPAHTRALAYALLRPGADPARPIRNLYEAAAQSDPGRAAATGRNPVRVMKALAGAPSPAIDVPASRLKWPDAPSSMPEAHRLAAHNNVTALAHLAAEHPERLRAEDHLGRTAVFEALTPEAARVLMDAGLDPFAPARHDPHGRHGARAIDLMLTRPIPRAAFQHTDQTPEQQRRSLLDATLAYAGARGARLRAEDPLLHAYYTQGAGAPTHRTERRAEPDRSY